MPGKPTIPRICEQCGEPFLGYTANIHRGQARFCSRSCALQFRIRKGLNPIEWFWSKVDKNGPIPAHRPELGPCWLWPVPPSNPYGRVKYEGEYWLPHRLSYTLTYGAMADDELACHHCDNPACVNPKHLFRGTSADNAHDRDRKGRNGARLTETDVIAIRDAFTGVRGQETALAREYGVNQSTIHRIVHRERWARVS